MRYVVLDSFKGDYARLSERERALFRKSLRAFVEACDRYAVEPAAPWPSALRVKPIQGAPGILEMTWSLSGPDGRATFEFIELDGELAVRWRRIGRHRILREP